MNTRCSTSGMDTSYFEASRLARVHDAMKRHVDRGAVPGLVLLLIHRGREYVDVIGSMAYDSNTPIRRDAICRLASMTKPITAVGAMVLIEECRLRLDDPVDDWLPELKNPKVLRGINAPLDDTVPAKRSITVRDLLTFRSGYGEVGFVSADRTLEKALLSPTCPLQKAMIEARLPLSAWRFVGTSDEFMKRVGSLPLAFQPGERWLYHMSAEILGVLIARASGQSLGTFLRERIFEPLGMHDTAFYVPESKLARVPTCYGVDMVTGHRVVLDEARGDWAQPPAFEAGGGGLVSTVDDMAAFGTMLLNRGRHGNQRILARPTVEAMTTDQLTPEQKALSPFFENFWDDHGWGFGVGLVTKRSDPAAAPGRFGWDGAFGSSWWVDPKEELVGVLMVQRRPDWLGIPPTIRDFWTSAYQLVDS
jgi:CubicO group peptidase (beta-lactamase class C family)